MDKTVLCYLERNNQYLMLFRNKKKNDLNGSKWIGVGGHLEKGETKEQALIREIKEETGLDIISFTYRGELLFINDDFEEIMYLYTSSDFKGELKECDEGELKYIDIDEVYDLPMWDGDRLFLPLIQQNKGVFEMSLGYDGDQLLDCIGPIYKQKKKGKKSGKRQKRN